MIDRVVNSTLHSLIPYALALFLAVWGGVVSYIQKVRRGDSSRWNITELVGEIVIAGFAGLLIYMVATSASLPPILCAALSGIGGHMGGRSLFMLETWAARKFG